jgi:transposase
MKKTMEMKIVHAHAAGIDVGSKTHYAAVGQQPDDIRSFGVYTDDHEQMAAWFKERGITTIAMESTGSYWQTLFASLQSAGFEVLLVNGKQIKNVKGKTDVKDCAWIQRLHSLGLLTGSFLPQEKVAKVRTYYRHRLSLIEQSAKMSNKMQKAMRLMNVRLDVALSDITGKSGRRIIEAILEGERDGKNLAQLADERVKKSKEEIALSLQGHWQEEYLYELKDCYDLYKIYQQKLDDCDAEIEKLLQQQITVIANKEKQLPKLNRKKHRKNQIKFDLSRLSYQYTGVDLFAIEGVSYNTIIAFIAEVGHDINKFATAKQFVSWLRLAPNNKISGNKLLSSRTPKGKNKLALALRQAANTVEQMKHGALVSFFKRIAYKKGRGAAITATARKIAVIIWKMITLQIPYKPMDELAYKEKIKEKVMKNIKSKMKRMSISINDLETCHGMS